MPLADGKQRLADDMVVMCWEGEHLRFALLAGLGILLYPVGMPLFLVALLQKAEQPAASQKYSFLKSLRARVREGRLAVEVLQLLFKVYWAGVLIFVGRGTATQMNTCILSVVCYGVLLNMLRAYNSPFDNMLWSAGFAKLLLTTGVGQLILLGEEMPGGAERTLGMSPLSAGRWLIAFDVALLVGVIVATVLELRQGQLRPIMPVLRKTGEEPGFEMTPRTRSNQVPELQLEAKESASISVPDDSRSTSPTLQVVAPAATPAATPAADSIEQRTQQRTEQMQQMQQQQPPSHRPPPPPPVVRWHTQGNQTGPSGIDLLTADNAISSAQAGLSSSEAPGRPSTADPFSAFFDDVAGEARLAEPDSGSLEQMQQQQPPVHRPPPPPPVVRLDRGGGVAGATGPAEGRDVAVSNSPRTTQESKSKNDRLARERPAQGEPPHDHSAAAAAAVAIKKQDGNGDLTPESGVRGLPTGGSHPSDEENPSISAETNNTAGAPMIRPAQWRKARPAARKSTVI